MDHIAGLKVFPTVYLEAFVLRDALIFLGFEELKNAETHGFDCVFVKQSKLAA
jgi:hypothetical protein